MSNKEIIDKLEQFFSQEQPDVHDYIWSLDLSDRTKERIEYKLVLARNHDIVRLFEEDGDDKTPRSQEKENPNILLC